MRGYWYHRIFSSRVILTLQITVRPMSCHATATCLSIRSKTNKEKLLSLEEVIPRISRMASNNEETVHHECHCKHAAELVRSQVDVVLRNALTSVNNVLNNFVESLSSQQETCCSQSYILKEKATKQPVEPEHISIATPSNRNRIPSAANTHQCKVENHNAAKMIGETAADVSTCISAPKLNELIFNGLGDANANEDQLVGEVSFDTLLTYQPAVVSLCRKLSLRELKSLSLVSKDWWEVTNEFLVDQAEIYVDRGDTEFLRK